MRRMHATVVFRIQPPGGTKIYLPQGCQYCAVPGNTGNIRCTYYSFNMHDTTSCVVFDLILHHTSHIFASLSCFEFNNYTSYVVELALLNWTVGRFGVTRVSTEPNFYWLFTCMLHQVWYTWANRRYMWIINWNNYRIRVNWRNL